MAILKRDEILAANDIVIELVDVPEWSEDKKAQVYVKGMTGAERDRFESSIVKQRGKEQVMDLADIRAKLASLTICDENGKRLFTDADTKALGQKSASALQRVFGIAQRLSGIGDEDVKELAEGVKTDPFDGLPSDSP
jgi:hypothetical protein